MFEGTPYLDSMECGVETLDTTVSTANDTYDSAWLRWLTLEVFSVFGFK